MMIDRLSGIDPVQNVNKTQKTRQTDKVAKNDSIQVSKEARVLSDVYLAAKIARSAPDIREERVEEVAKKLENPNYIDDTILGAVADKLIDLFEM